MVAGRWMVLPGLRGKTSLEPCSLVLWLLCFRMSMSRPARHYGYRDNLPAEYFFYCGDKILIDNPRWLQTCFYLSPSNPSYYRRMLPCLAWAKSFWASAISSSLLAAFLAGSEANVEDHVFMAFAHSFFFLKWACSLWTAPVCVLSLTWQSHKADTVLILFSMCMICMWLQACYSTCVEVRG